MALEVLLTMAEQAPHVLRGDARAKKKKNKKKKDNALDAEVSGTGTTSDESSLLSSLLSLLLSMMTECGGDRESDDWSRLSFPFSPSGEVDETALEAGEADDDTPSPAAVDACCRLVRALGARLILRPMATIATQALAQAQMIEMQVTQAVGGGNATNHSSPQQREQIWKLRRAALLLLSSVAAGAVDGGDAFRKVVLRTAAGRKLLKLVAGACSATLTASSSSGGGGGGSCCPRAACAALQCISRCARAFAPTFQKKYASTLLPVIGSIIATASPPSLSSSSSSSPCASSSSSSSSSSACPRVVFAAVGSLCDFCDGDDENEEEQEEGGGGGGGGRGCPSASLSPYVEPLLQALFRLLPDGSTGMNSRGGRSELVTDTWLLIQEFSLAAVSSIAGATKDEFARYYPVFMPVGA